MPLVLSTFDSGVVAGLVGLLRGYLEALGVEKMPAVVSQEEKIPQTLPLVVVSVTELEEFIYQSGNYRCGVEVGVRVDMDTGTPEQLRTLSAGVLDCLQQDDLIAQLNALKDDAGRPLCYVQLVVLNQSRMEDIGDRQWRRVFALDVFGCVTS